MIALLAYYETEEIEHLWNYCILSLSHLLSQLFTQTLGYQAKQCHLMDTLA
jgi:hypothetical protein